VYVVVQRLVVVLVLFVGLVGIWIGGCQTPEQKVEKLISKLQHKNPKVRQTAVVALTKIGKDAVPVLIQALQDGSRGIRASAAGVLGQIGAGAVDASPALIKTLQNPEVRWHAEGALAKIGKGAVPILIQALQDPEVRQYATRVLAKIGEDAKDKMFGITEIGLMWSGLGKKTGGKEKSLIIKDYIDGMEKIMKKHSKSLGSVLTDYTKKRTLDPDPDSGDVAMWDELVVNNFTIQKIHVSPEFSPDFAPLEKGEGGERMYTFGDRDADIEGFPFELYYEVGDMVDYINRTLR